MQFRARLHHGFLIVSFLFSAAVQADEGMWQPSQMPALSAQAKALGMEIDPDRLSALTEYPLNAIVNLGGFCTASFVSDQGLIATNHHCAYGSIQFNSTPEKNLLQDGFVANDFAAELRVDPTVRLYVTDRIKDVTAKIVQDLPAKLVGAARFKIIDKRSKNLVAECERTPGYRCDVYNFYGGAKYSMIRLIEIKDVRLVYAPSNKIGNFGGDIDNWMWPRHTGDFSFLRAYVDRKGNPAAYDKANVPYQPKASLKVDPKGLSEGDFAMLAGYPGRTNRTRLAEELTDVIDWQYPRSIQYLREAIEVIESAVNKQDAAAIKYAAFLASLNNSLKNLQGQLEGFSHSTAVTDKRADEAALLAWVRADKNRSQAYAADIEGLQAELRRIRDTRERDLVYGSVLGFGGSSPIAQLLTTARDLYWMSKERKKPDTERMLGYQQRDEARFEGRLQSFDKRFDKKVDRALMTLWLKRYLALPAKDRSRELDAWLGITASVSTVPDLEKHLDRLYAETGLDNVEERLRWFKADLKDFAKSDDAFIRLALALVPVWERAETETQNRIGNESRWRSRYLAALSAYREETGKPLYPDANSTLRITIGKVTGYQPRDGVSYQPFTQLEGVLAKVTDKEPFMQPAAAVSAMQAKQYAGYAAPALGTVPVNFLTNLDITGGNSGSPTLNKRGEMVGLVFDGNWESVSSNWVFNPALTRAIHVDVRYMLWVMDEVDHAERLIKEMGLQPHSP